MSTMIYTAELTIHRDDGTSGGRLRDLAALPAIHLYWPVASLPAEMGWVETAERLSDDVFAPYYLLARVSFSRDEVDIVGIREASDGTRLRAAISYEALHLLIAAADLRVRHQEADTELLVYCRDQRASAPQRASLRLTWRAADERAADAALDALPSWLRASRP